MSGSWSRQAFPALRKSDFKITSRATQLYNCIAWAAADTETWWWPDDPQIGYSYWPPGVRREETVQAFLEAYGTLGYEPCADASREPGYEKIAIYALSNGTPTHAARQLPNGRWTSKLGSCEDIEHASLECLQGGTYGRAVAYLKRRIR